MSSVQAFLEYNSQWKLQPVTSNYPVHVILYRYPANDKTALLRWMLTQRSVTWIDMTRPIESFAFIISESSF